MWRHAIFIKPPHSNRLYEYPITIAYCKVVTGYEGLYLDYTIAARKFSARRR